jgi:hypothetical protein
MNIKFLQNPIYLYVMLCVNIIGSLINFNSPHGFWLTYTCGTIQLALALYYAIYLYVMTRDSFKQTMHNLIDKL